jgi:hypothetical protein
MMKNILIENKDNLIERNMKVILELLRNSQITKNPIFSKVRVRFDGERFIVKVFVNRVEMDDDLQFFLDDIFELVSDYTFKPVYVEWEGVK